MRLNAVQSRMMSVQVGPNQLPIGLAGGPRMGLAAPPPPPPPYPGPPPPYPGSTNQQQVQQQVSFDRFFL